LNKSDSFLDLPLATNFTLVEDISKEVLYYTSNKESFLPTIENKDKMRFKPVQYKNIEYNLQNSSGGQLYFSDLGLTFEDVFFNRNRYKKSFLRIDLFDSSEPYNQRRVAQYQIFNRVDVAQRDVNGNLLPINAMPVSFSLYSPLDFFNRRSEGFYLYLRPNMYARLYAYFYYANAVNGQIIPLNSTTLTLTQQNILQNNFIEYQVNNANQANTFTINQTNRNIFINGFGKMTIDLKQTIV
jgi:hypothetical protein